MKTRKELIGDAQRARAKAEKSGYDQDYVAAGDAYDRARIATWQSIDPGTPGYDLPPSVRRGIADRAVSLGKIATRQKDEAKAIQRAREEGRRGVWAKRDVMKGLQPPTTVNVIDPNSGFTAVTKARFHGRGKAPKFAEKPEAWIGGQTLWGPYDVLRGETEGKLVVFKNDSFYQNDHDVTIALYKVKGYPYPIALWFSNRTGERVA